MAQMDDPSWPKAGRGAGKNPARLFFTATAILVLVFGKPLFDLTRLAIDNSLYSYIPLIPFISLYLIWLQKKKLPAISPPAHTLAAGFIAGGFAVMAAYWLTRHFVSRLVIEDYLAFNIFACLLFFAGVCAEFLGGKLLRALAFPVSLLVFMVPLPDVFRDNIETFLQHGSATMAGVFFTISGLPFFQDGLRFKLADITLQVAPECSGIHSSLVLFITSLLAGHLFLRGPWKRTTLAVAVIPLALLRNGFRIFVLGELCVHVGPQMIDSPIHHQGGPLFFVLSLIPFFLLLIFLKKSETRTGKSSSQTLQK
jgi:exosortase C (VPDSG-CTERM-specific)